MSKFAEQKARLKAAIGWMVHEADEIAHGKRKGEKGASLSDVLGKE